MLELVGLGIRKFLFSATGIGTEVAVGRGGLER